MSLTTLPPEILISLPLFVDDLKTFINAAASCRILRNAFYTASPNTIVRLADGLPDFFGYPRRHFLIMATASQVGKWALGDEEHTAVLRKALKGGTDGLNKLCLEVAGLTIPDLRCLNPAFSAITDPLLAKVDGMVDYTVRSPLKNIRDGSLTPFPEPYWVVTRILTYGELFGPSMNASLASQQLGGDDTFSPACFDMQTRMHYVAHFVPEDICMSQEFVTGIPGNYVIGPERRDQLDLYKFLTCRDWRWMWNAAIREVLYGGSLKDFPDEDDIGDEHWRQRLLRDAIQFQGVEGMKLVTIPASELDRGFVNKLMWIKEQVDRLKEPPVSEAVAQATVRSHVPDLLGELSVWDST